MKNLPAILLLLLHCLLAAAPLQAQTTATNRVRGSDLQTTNSIAWSNTFLAIVFPYPHPYHSNGTMQISAFDLLESLKLFPNWPSSTGEVTTAQLLAASNEVWAAQAARAPTNNAVIHSSSISSVPLTLFGKAGQDGNMLNVKDSSGNVLFAIGYDGVFAGEGANSARLASTSTAGHIWTASDNTGIGAFAAPAQQTNSSIVRQLELTAASNAAVAFSMTVSNTLYGTETTRNAAVSNAVVSFAMTVSNAVYTTETTRNAAVSNAAVAFTMTASNTLYSLIGSGGSGGTNNPILFSGGTLTLIANQTSRHQHATNASFAFTIAGSSNQSSIFRAQFENTSTNTIYATNVNGFYSVGLGSNAITTLTLPGNSMLLVDGYLDVSNRWVLTETFAGYALEFGNGSTATNHTTKTITYTAPTTGSVTNNGITNATVIGQVEGTSAIKTVTAGTGVTITDRGTNLLFSSTASGASFNETNITVSTTAEVVVDLAAFDIIKIKLLTNLTTLTLSNQATMGKRAQIYFQQDTNGTRTIAANQVAGGILQTNANLQPTTNANALDMLEIMPGFFSSNAIAWWPQNFQPRVAFTNSLSDGSSGSGIDLTNGIIAYWELDDDTVWADSSGNGFTLTETGTAIANVAGILGNAADFPLDTANLLSRADHNAFSALSNNFTIATWVNLDATNSRMVFVSKDNATAGGREYGLQWMSQGYWAWSVFTNGNTLTELAITNSVVLNDWYFLCAQIDITNKVSKLRVGTTASLGAWSTSPTFGGWGGAGYGTNTTTALRISGITGAPGLYPIDGQLDDPAMWSRMLSDAEVEALWNSGAGLAWPFE